MLSTKVMHKTSNVTSFSEWLDRLAVRDKVLADAAYTAWLKAENPKRSMASSDWAELFRRSHLAGHPLFEVPELN